ncbi:prepilin-type N-terminal cleavage/methylation domain-containing protein [Nitrospina gracilis]|uniref:prepilin-type N-terminal cleavage/methylation domain-containing protein n=1 Tax=Nitrospina gracilis TaxID=35801 RepID=UPI001F2E1B31|nr:prepilin-type N-terminal cleavage/methylation domain-containing protein [Nitrospina gracilis]MCF8721539.1 type II secretory pathway pseudopilin PulG [Nitrospina gracilis Nb-211]
MAGRRHLLSNTSRNEYGFTLVEAVLVVVLVGILGALFLPRLASDAIPLNSATSMVTADLKFAQELAMSRNPSAGSPIGITFSGGSSSYTLTDPVGAFTASRTFPGGVTISTGGTINFNKYGEPQTISTITLTAPDGSNHSITVEAFSGRVIVS